MYFSKKQGGFYLSAIDDDAVEITDQQHAALLAGQAAGLVITTDTNGAPVLSSPQPSDAHVWTGSGWQFDLDLARSEKIRAIQASFISAVGQGHACSTSIKMNADIIDIQRLKSAYDLAVLVGQTSLPIVVDYNNQSHAAVALADVLTMIIELGVHYQTLYFKKQTQRSDAAVATTQAQLDAIVW